MVVRWVAWHTDVYPQGHPMNISRAYVTDSAAIVSKMRTVIGFFARFIAQEALVEHL